jgi:hypothetical protein
MAEVEAFAKAIRDVSAGTRFASVKIDAANLERVLPMRGGIFILTRGDLDWPQSRAAAPAGARREPSLDTP